MDPNFFHVELDRALEVFVAIVLISMILERGLALVFEHRWYIKRFHEKGYKTIIAFLAALFVCSYWKFDAVSIIILQDNNSWPGYVLTAGVIAGGSKASIALFHDFLKVQSTALRARNEQGAPQENPNEEAGQ